MAKSKKMYYNKGIGYKMDSKFEESLIDGIMKDIPYHSEVIEYEQPSTKHKYTPDWVYVKIKGMASETYLIEAKGRFRSREEMQKYIWIQEELSGKTCFHELVFIFQKPNLPVFGAKARKNGSKMSHAEWAEKHGFRWFTESTIKELLNENV